MATTLIIIGAAGLVLVVVLAIHKNLFRNWKLRDALQAFEEAQYSTARDILESIATGDSGNALVTWFMARCSLEMGETNRAVGELKKVLQINSFEVDESQYPGIKDFTEVGVHKLLRDIYRKANQDENAFTENQILMRLEPEAVEHPLALADSLIRRKEFSERTIQFLSSALEINSQHADAHTWLALVYFKQGSWNKSNNHGRKALELQPGLLDPQYFVGEILYKNNDHEQAIAFLEKAAMSSYFQKSATFSLAKIHYQQGKLDEAEKWAVKSDACPSSLHEEEDLEWEVKYLMGLVYQDLGKSKNAQEVFEHIEKYKPGYKDVAERLDSVSSAGGEFIKDFLTAKTDLFATLSEEIINKLGYKVQKIETTNDGGLSMIARSQELSPQNFAVFVRRNYDLINADQVQNLRKYKSSMNCQGGIFINTGEFTTSAREAASKASIELINGERIEALLAEVNKAGI